MTPRPPLSRRTLLQAGTLGLAGTGLAEVLAARKTALAPRSVLVVFLSGGLSQLDSFDMKPEAPARVRGEFQPVATRVPGLQICEHLPGLANRAHRLTLLRSLTHWSNEHNEAHTIMLTGRSELPPGYRANRPQPSDWPAVTAVAGRMVADRNNGLPSSVVLPQRLINMNQGGVVTPGQFGGQMGPQFDPWFIEASPYRGGDVKGSYPQFAYCRRTESLVKDRSRFQAPVLRLPEGLTDRRLSRRAELLSVIENQRKSLERHATTARLGRHREAAISLLTDPRVQNAFDVVNAPDREADRYGRHLFGWTLLMASRLIGAGVPVVQANLGNYNTWDLHGGIFRMSRDWLYPPADQAISALLDDLNESGLLETTLVAIVGEFGRTPKIFKVPNAYVTPGRDHWGAVQTAVFAGAGTAAGHVIGASDKLAAYPVSSPRRPEDLAATIYRTLGLPPTTAWPDADGRPHFIYHGRPITGIGTNA